MQENKKLRIKVSDLRTIADNLFVRLEEKGHTEIEITEDFYWNISKEDRYAIDREPSEFSLGQLYDDWEFVKNSLDSNENTVLYEFVWLSSILRFIGEHYDE